MDYAKPATIEDSIAVTLYLLACLQMYCWSHYGNLSWPSLVTHGEASHAV